MSIDARQSTDLTDEVDRLHRESTPTLREESEDPAVEPRHSRRDLLKKAGAGGALPTGRQCGHGECGHGYLRVDT